jgi:hypothetical protein
LRAEFLRHEYTPHCFLTPLKFQGRNPTIPTDPRLDSGWATGPSIGLPKGQTPDDQGVHLAGQQCGVPASR